MRCARKRCPWRWGGQPNPDNIAAEVPLPPLMIEPGDSAADRPVLATLADRWAAMVQLWWGVESSTTSEVPGGGGDSGRWHGRWSDGRLGLSRRGRRDPRRRLALELGAATVGILRGGAGVVTVEIIG